MIKELRQTLYNNLLFTQSSRDGVQTAPASKVRHARVKSATHTAANIYRNKRSLLSKQESRYKPLGEETADQNVVQQKISRTRSTKQYFSPLRNTQE
jgi:hypothetical protein